MAITIKYLNDLDKSITAQQAVILTDYSKEIYKDNELKKVEVYRNSSLWGGTYYLEIGEDPINILNNLGPNLKWSLGSNKQIVNNYVVWEYRFYNENLQAEAEYSKIVRDNYGNTIAVVAYSTQSNLPQGAIKTFHFGGQFVPDDETKFDDDAKVDFYFNENNEIERIEMNTFYVNNEEIWRTLNDFQIDANFFIDAMMPPNVLTYFTNVEPLVPPF
jgi:hypothetical protein